MLYFDEDEMTDDEVRVKYDELIKTAIAAFAIDVTYSADIAKKAQIIKAREQRKIS